MGCTAAHAHQIESSSLLQVRTVPNGPPVARTICRKLLKSLKSVPSCSEWLEFRRQTKHHRIAFPWTRTKLQFQVVGSAGERFRCGKWPPLNWLRLDSVQFNWTLNHVFCSPFVRSFDSLEVHKNNITVLGFCNEWCGRWSVASIRWEIFSCNANQQCDCSMD